MLKRGAEEDGGPEPKKAPGKSSGSGSKAEEVTNPIPRLFSQNTITIHITQRTFEEIGVNELKWIPTSQYYAAMFDKFHARMFKQYYDRCSTFQITDPKIRISNILMLQDMQKTQSGTPEDISVFTQACYLMHYQPKGIKNWFRLGVSNDCMKSQKYLSYQPMVPTDCNTISQLVSLKNYTDFEQLVINPAKADFYAGWHSGETMVTSSDTTELSCKLLDALADEINIDENKIEENKEYYVSDVFISPRSPYLRDFSCSVKGCEPHIEMSKHTTYCRNLDKINLHKYGDSFGFHVNTNLEGVHMMKHDANNPFGHTFTVPTKGSKVADTKVKSVFCYPSENRPFYSRFNNFDMNGPINSTKGFGGLTHHFLTMPPIRKGDKVMIKQRCSFIMEQTMSITFHFPETVTEDMAEDMLKQRDAVILRPAIVSMNKGDPTKSPDQPGGSVFDPIRDKIRDSVKDVTNVELPSAENINFNDRAVGYRTPRFDKRWSLPANLAQLCEELGLEAVCSDLRAIIKSGIAGRPTAIDFQNLIGLAPPAIKESMLIDGKYIPAVKHKYELRDSQLEDWEIEKMNENTTGSRNLALFGYLFWDFMYYLKKNNLLEIPYNKVDNEFPQENYNYDGRRVTLKLSNWLKDGTADVLDDMFGDKCVEYTMRLYPDQIKSMTIWSRKSSEQHTDWDNEEKVDFKSLLPTTSKYPVTFNIVDWIHYLWRMRLWIMPRYEVVKGFIDRYNACINQQIEEELPRIPLTPEQIKLLKDKGLLESPQNVEPNPYITDKHFNYTTSVFFT